MSQFHQASVTLEGPIDGNDTRTWGFGEAAAAGVTVDLPRRWRLIRPLGRGGQAEVWLAEDRELGEQVALKIFGSPRDASAKERWRREVRIGRRLQHPNLLRLYDLVDADGGMVAVMEPMQGGTLADRLEQGPLPIEEVIALAERLLDVLAYLHREDMVHRDVKPSNILFARDGTPKLGDLGLVRELEGGLSLTATLTAVGTPSYMAPEQLRGETPQPSWDLYALGVTLFEAVTGRPPFQGGSGFDVADGHLHRAAPSPRRLRPDCPRWLSHLVERLLEKRPQRRWPSAEAALAALKRRKVGRSPTARLRLIAAVTGVAALLALGAGTAHVAMERREVADVTVSNGQLMALDADGHELWRYRSENGGIRGAVGRFLPMAGRQVLLLERRAGEGTDDPPVWLHVLDARGRVAETWPLQLHRRWQVSSEGWQSTQLLVSDLDGDGLDEAFVLLIHRLWYPSEVVFFGEREGIRGAYPLFGNGGHLEDLTTADLDGDGVLDLLMAGLDNPMGFQAAVAAMSGRMILHGAVAMSPDATVGGEAHYGESYLAPLLFYTPLGSVMPVGNNAMEITEAGERIVVSGSFGSVALDAAGNPLHSPLARAGPEPRRLFWEDLQALCRALADPASGLVGSGAGKLSGHRGAWQTAWSRFCRRHAHVLRENPSRAAAVLLVARSLAQERAYGPATALLEEGAVLLPQERDLWLRLGEYRLLAGDREGGRRAVLRSAASAGTGRNLFDAFFILGMDAAIHGDEAALEEADGLLRHDPARNGALSNIGRALRLVLYFFRGRWDDPRFHLLREDPVIPALAWVQRWVDLERGGDPIRVLGDTRKALPHDELPVLGHLVEAECLRRTGRAEEALGVADRAAAALELEGASRFEFAVWSPLAQWELGRCLLDLGRGDEGRLHLERVVRAAPETWFARDARRRLGSAG